MSVSALQVLQYSRQPSPTATKPVSVTFAQWLKKMFGTILTLWVCVFLSVSFVLLLFDCISISWNIFKLVACQLCMIL